MVNQTTYDSFGQVLEETNSLLGDRYKFTGRELNTGSDYYYRARIFGASAGRFTSLDPIGFRSSSANLYRYVENSPLDQVDPSGEVSVAEFVGTAGSLVLITVLGTDLLCSQGVITDSSLCRGADLLAVSIERIFRRIGIEGLVINGPGI